MYGKGFTIQGTSAPHADMGANSVSAKTNGYTNIIYKNTKANIFLWQPILNITVILVNN